MGGSAKSGGGTGAHDYFGTIAGLVCAGRVDSVLGIIADGKTVWPEAEGGAWKTASAYDFGTMVHSGGRAWTATITHTSDEFTEPGLPGAPWVGYALNRTDPGVGNPVSITVPGYGVAILYWGTDEQVHGVGTPSEITDEHPPYRNQCWVILRDWLFGRERVSAPSVEVLVRRAPVQSVVTGSASTLDADGQANPIAFAAEMVSDPVFGAGQPGLIDQPSWQAAAEILDLDKNRWNLSPVISEATNFDAVVEALGLYANGFKRTSGDGKIELGILPDSEAPPEWTAENIIDETCLAEPMEVSTDGATTNSVVVRYSDRTRSFKLRTAKASDTLSRGAVAAEAESIDLPWITRANQAAAAAADRLRRRADPEFTGRAVCVAERVQGIREGSVFLLRDSVSGIEMPCRCETITDSAPPSSRRTIGFRSETGFSPVLALDGSGQSAGFTEPDAERIDLVQLFQPPPSLVGGENFALLALCGRTSRVTTSVRLWMQETDPSLFADMGAQGSFAVFGEVQTFYPDWLPAATTQQDDDSESFRVIIDPATPAADIAGLGETQTADMVNDARFLIFAFDGSGEVEVLTMKAIRIEGAEAFWRIKVRRARFGTSRLSLSAGDRVCIIRRASLVPYTHQRFGAYAVTATPAVFRLQAVNPWRTAELSDPAVCPDLPFVFSDPFGPRVEWTRVEQRPTSGSAWADVTVFTTDHPPGTEFRVSATLRDSSSDLVSVILASIGPESAEANLYSDAVAGGVDTVTAAFVLGEGDWTIVLRVRDRTDRLTEAALTEIGSPTQVTLRVRPPGSTVVANPVPIPRGGSFFADPSVSLPCSTPAATVEWQTVPLGDPVGGVWTVGGSVTVPLNSTLYTRASLVGWTDSPITRDDYRFLDPESVA